MISSRKLVIGIGSVVMIALVGWWWHLTFERVSREIALPARGEARYNPLFALKLALAAQGREVVARPHLDLRRLDAGDVVILGSDVRALTEAQADGLVEWVEGGGRLVFAIPPGAEGRPAHLLEHFDVAVTPHQSCTNWKKDGDIAAGTLCSAFRLAVPTGNVASFDWLWGNATDGYVFGRRDWGDGQWLAVADLSFLHNTTLDDDGMAALAWQVLAPMLGDGTVHLVYSADVPPLYVLIVRHGWPVLALLLLALLGGLWARAQRLGPVLPLAAPDRRALREHVQASGEFAFARGGAIALHAALMRRLLARLAARDPALATLRGDELAQALADKTGLPLDDVRQAVQPTDLARPDRFVATLHTLMQLQART